MLLNGVYQSTEIIKCNLRYNERIHENYKIYRITITNNEFMQQKWFFTK